MPEPTSTATPSAAERNAPTFADRRKAREAGRKGGLAKAEANRNRSLQSPRKRLVDAISSGDKLKKLIKVVEDVAYAEGDFEPEVLESGVVNHRVDPDLRFKAATTLLTYAAGKPHQNREEETPPEDGPSFTFSGGDE